MTSRARLTDPQSIRTAPAVADAARGALAPLDGRQGVGGDPLEASVARTVEVAQTRAGIKRFAPGASTPPDPSARAANEAAATLHGDASDKRQCRCGKPITGRRRVACSDSCANAAYEAKRRPPRPTCVTCSRTISAGRQRYCSARCSLVARGQARATALEERTCALDGCEVTFTPRRDSEHCCSERHGKTHYNRQARAAARTIEGSHRG